MGFGGISLLNALSDKMKWHQERQTLLAENIANAETPNFRGRDLSPYSFAGQLAAQSSATVTTVATNPTHFSVSSDGGTGGFDPANATTFEVTPEGNDVSLEDEMMKVTSNQLDYQTITTLYTRSLALIRTALGRTA